MSYRLKNIISQSKHIEHLYTLEKCTRLLKYSHINNYLRGVGNQPDNTLKLKKYMRIMILCCQYNPQLLEEAAEYYFHVVKHPRWHEQSESRLRSSSFLVASADSPSYEPLQQILYQLHTINNLAKYLLVCDITLFIIM